jgi:hypothetical protein
MTEGRPTTEDGTRVRRAALAAARRVDIVVLMADLHDMTSRALRRMLIARQAEHRVPGMVGGVVRD